MGIFLCLNDSGSLILSMFMHVYIYIFTVCMYMVYYIYIHTFTSHNKFVLMDISLEIFQNCKGNVY